jgi:hypothetical protein
MTQSGRADQALNTQTRIPGETQKEKKNSKEQAIADYTLTAGAVLQHFSFSSNQSAILPKNKFWKKLLI